MNDERVLSLIDRVYAAADDPALWPAYLEEVSGMLRSKMTVLMYQDTQNLSATVGAAVRIDPDAVRLYQDYYAARNIFLTGAQARLPSGTMMCESDISERAFLRSEYFGDYLDPQDVRYIAGLVVVNEQGVLSILSTMRSRAAGPFEDSDFALLRTLCPHLQRAWQLHRRLSAAEERVRIHAESLDLLDDGVVVLDGKGRIHSMNRSAQRILTDRDGLSDQGGVLSASSSTANRTLSALVVEARRAASGTSFGSAGTIGIERPSGRRPYQVVVSPLRCDASRTDDAHVAILITDPISTDQRASQLCQSCGLTPTETRLATLLACGQRLETAADLLGVSKNTARTHLKRVFVKTATRRQADLVHLLRP